MMDYLFPAALGGYGLLSYFFLKNPLLLHRRKSCVYAKLIAHRGGAGEGFENTMATFRKAVTLGCEMLETDVRMSKDGKAVVIHDKILSRLTGENFEINEVDYRSLPAMKSKVAIDFEPGEYFDGSHLDRNEGQFTTLDEVVRQFRDTQINIDIKEYNPALVTEVNRIICENGAEDRCVWGSFSDKTTQLCYRTNPDIGLFFSASRLLQLLLLFYSGLLPFVPLKETHLEVPMLSVFLSEKYASDASNISFGKLPRLLLRVCNVLLLRPSLLKHLNDRGIPTYVWVLNTEADFRTALDLGAAGIMTDYPTRLKAFYSQRQHSGLN